MRNQKSLSLVESLLTLVVIVIIGNVGCSRQEAGKSLSHAGNASEPVAKQIQQQRSQPEKTDKTADWITYVGSESRFSLRHPKHWAVGAKQPQRCSERVRSDFTAGANAELVCDCGTEYFGQIYVSSTEGNHLSDHDLTTSEYPYQNITRQKVKVDNFEGARVSGTAMGQMDDKFAMPGLPDGAKVVIYSFYAHGRTYVAKYEQRIDEPDILRDFDLMVTKTLKFSNY
jgi:hypothetical protein